MPEIASSNLARATRASPEAAWTRSSVGRAPPRHGEGQGFDPLRVYVATSVARRLCRPEQTDHRRIVLRCNGAPAPTALSGQQCGCSSDGRASDFQSECRRFEAGLPLRAEHAPSPTDIGTGQHVRPPCGRASPGARPYQARPGLSGPGLTRGGLSGLVAQLVERLVRNEEAEGSTPFRSTDGMRRDPSRRPGLRSRSNAWRGHPRRRDRRAEGHGPSSSTRPDADIWRTCRLCAPFTLRNIGYPVTVPCVRPTSCGTTKPR